MRRRNLAIRMTAFDDSTAATEIEKRDDFLVVDRSGTANNCDEHFFKEDERLILAPHQ